MLPKMHKQWMHREVKAMKEVGDREMALGWWDLPSAWRRFQIG